MSRSRDNFVRLAERRTNKVLKDLDLIGNLSNKSNYSYSHDDIRKIFSAINKRIREIELQFQAQNKGKEKDTFRL